MRSQTAEPETGVRPTTLAIDIGGTGLKATVLDAKGNMLADRVRVKTPHPVDRQLLVDTLVELAKPLPPFDRVSVGFPGVVRNGVLRTAANLGEQEFRGFDLARALTERLGKPVRVINDADMQGFAAIKGEGVEMVITLGTGFGSAMFLDGKLGPHLELAHHPFHKGKTYEEELGDEARKKLGKKKWARRVHEAIDELRALTNFDHLYIGGGNAKRLDADLPEDVSLVDNTAGVLGGIRLWEESQKES
ncbi:MAG: ROK family protein [Gemmatimonadetes bacterium]|nr:ROK family protein [Gemmatimonadota bacterium]